MMKYVGDFEIVVKYISLVEIYSHIYRIVLVENDGEI